MLPLLVAALLGAAPDAGVPALPTLKLEGMLVPTARELQPSPALRALAGKRVSVQGFMARMEVVPAGGFYLTATPVVCDEAGAGTGDLPPDALWVVVRSLPGEGVPYTPRLLQLTGVLELGPRVEPDGRTTHLRLLLDRAEDLAPVAPAVSSAVNPSPKEKKR